MNLSRSAASLFWPRFLSSKTAVGALCAGALFCVSGTAMARHPLAHARKAHDMPHAVSHHALSHAGSHHAMSHAVSHHAMPAMLLAPVLTAGVLPETPADVPEAGKPYSLKLAALHTGESIDIVYRIGDTYIPEALDKLNHFLRDHRTDEVTHYDPKEFDLLHNLMARLGRPSGEVDVVCGYRTEETNELLREDSAATGVAKHSQHIEGHAIDIRVPGVGTAQVRNAALSLGAGGVGYYPTSQFVHVDVGPVRQWTFGARPVKGRRGRGHGGKTRRRRS